MTAEQAFVIVGGGLAGAKAAETLRDEGFDGGLVFVGAEEERPYERPPLSKEYLRGEARRETLFVHDDGFYAEQGIELRLGRTAVALNPASRELALDDGDAVRYDRLRLATGAEPRRLPLAGADLDAVLYLRSVEDSDALRERLDRGGTAVVVGAGWIGTEVAASARQRGLDVTVLDLHAVPLERVLGGWSGRRLRASAVPVSATGPACGRRRGASPRPGTGSRRRMHQAARRAAADLRRERVPEHPPALPRRRPPGLAAPTGAQPAGRRRAPRPPARALSDPRGSTATSTRPSAAAAARGSSGGATRAAGGRRCATCPARRTARTAPRWATCSRTSATALGSGTSSDYRATGLTHLVLRSSSCGPRLEASVARRPWTRVSRCCDSRMATACGRRGPAARERCSRSNAKCSDAARKPESADRLARRHATPPRVCELREECGPADHAMPNPIASVPSAVRPRLGQAHSAPGRRRGFSLV